MLKCISVKVSLKLYIDARTPQDMDKAVHTNFAQSEIDLQISQQKFELSLNYEESSPNFEATVYKIGLLRPFED